METMLRKPKPFFLIVQDIKWWQNKASAQPNCTSRLVSINLICWSPVQNHSWRVQTHCWNPSPLTHPKRGGNHTSYVPKSFHQWNILWSYVKWRGRVYMSLLSIEIAIDWHKVEGLALIKLVYNPHYRNIQWLFSLYIIYVLIPHKPILAKANVHQLRHRKRAPHRKQT